MSIFEITIPAPKDADSKRNIAQKNELITKTSAQAAHLIDAFESNLNLDGKDLNHLIEVLEHSNQKASKGDLSDVESMLMSQAATLNVIFTSLAKRASKQEYVPGYKTFITLAFKAQAQSRATLQALVQARRPKEVSFIKQANITSGHQQINNQNANNAINSKEIEISKNELLEEAFDGSQILDIRTKRAAAGSHQEMVTLEPINRSKNKSWEV